MMPPMLLQRIQQHFIESADLSYQAAQTLGPAVDAATSAVLAAVTNGGKVLAWGMGPAAGLAQTLATAFVGQFERERPELAALALCADNALERQVRALGLPGDVLLLCTLPGATPDDILTAVQAAHEREMTVVALTPVQASELESLLKDTDVWVAVPSERLPRVLEAQQLVLHCICDGVDVQLLGDDPETEVNT